MVIVYGIHYSSGQGGLSFKIIHLDIHMYSIATRYLYNSIIVEYIFLENILLKKLINWERNFNGGLSLKEIAYSYLFHSHKVVIK